jgi:uncharacterized membrane protein YccC
VVPLALSVQEARPELGWMALGGWLGTLVDPGGSRGARARVLVTFALLGAVVVAITEAGGRAPIAGALLLGVIALAGTMLGALGAAAATMGSVLGVVAAVGVASGDGAPAKDAAWFVLGAGSAVVLSSVVWPVWTHLPVRRAVGAVWSELARYAEAIDASARGSEAHDGDAWVSLARRHARSVRAALEHARAISVAVHARRGKESAVGGNLRVLLGMAESQFLVLVAVASELEGRARTGEPANGAGLARLVATYDRIRDALVARVWRPLPAHAESRPPVADDADVLGGLAAELARESEASLTIAGALDREETSPQAAAPEDAPVATRLAVAARLLRDAMSPRAEVAHRAVRVGLAGAAAVIAGALFFPEHGAWVTVTALVVVQSDTGTTVKRVLERVVGTVLGGALAIGLIAARPSGLAVTAIMFPLSVAAVVTRPRSYGLFAFFLTPIFVLIAVRTPGDWSVAVARGADTLAGGAIALAVTVLFFPRWHEHVGLPDALAEMRRAARRYSATVERTLGARTPLALQHIDATRRSAAAAVGRAEEAFERWTADPLRSGRGEGRTLELVTLGRRLVLATTTLDTIASRSPPSRASAAVTAARARVRRYARLLRLSATAKS